MNLSTYLRSQSIETDSITDWLNNSTKTKVYPKGHTLVTEGEHSYRVFYVETGLIRSYYMKDDKDVTEDFFPEQSVTATIESALFGRPSRYSIEVLETSTITTCNFNDFARLSSQNTEINQLEKLVLYNVVKKLSDNNYYLKFHSAKERYERMIKEYPNILLRAPLGHVASYLGITQQTLSVIRAQL
ncbi:Crp/Fnr family transcriptional regulator [Emticicia sp. TH156]|uniref:Crp/Fnr family transcriptional regulator n=1 Tax=Emticicia sp. TH156 TaxID=2067454 RepID=UPI000C76829F|nr:Crp/Fnr family transcriptional regulator [Emticicia sp. TH156]PLK44011.1 Crp/Fnr family transcriptional regulator [Emticicia sp. TH156]